MVCTISLCLRVRVVVHPVYARSIPKKNGDVPTKCIFTVADQYFSGSVHEEKGGMREGHSRTREGFGVCSPGNRRACQRLLFDSHGFFPTTNTDDGAVQTGAFPSATIASPWRLQIVHPSHGAKWPTLVNASSTIPHRELLTESNSVTHPGTWSKSWVIHQGNRTTRRPRSNFRYNPPRLYGSAPRTRRPRHCHAPRRSSGTQSVFFNLQSNVCVDSASHPSEIVPDSTKQQEHSHPRGGKFPPPEVEVSRRSTTLFILHG